MKLLLVRHGITEFNSTRRFMGDSDIALSAEGIRQVERLRDRLAKVRIDAAYSSNLERAMTTARTIATGHNIEVVPCPELREVSYGEVEGLTFSEISRRYPSVAEKCTNFTLDLAFPGGESFPAFIERTCRFLDRLKAHCPKDTVLVASHGGPLRVLIYRLLGIGMEHWWQMRVDNGSLSIVDTYPRGAILSLLNDVSHLDNIPDE